MSTSATAAMIQDEVDRFIDDIDAVNVRPVEPVADTSSKKRKKADEEPAIKKAAKVQENRAIYVTKLPLDTNEVEINEVFSKYGIIDQGADGNKRIKMYTDDEGNFNGEALIVYFKKDSIKLAIDMLDDYYFRIEEQNNGTIRVKEADFSYKRNKDSEQIVSKLTRKDKKASERNRADLNRKLAEWSDNEEEVAEVFAPKKNKWAKVCILKGLFTLEELDDDIEAYADIKTELREEAERFGDVTNVTLFDKEVDGIATVRFRDFESAEKFRKKCNGRLFARRELEVTIAEEKPRFRKSARGGDSSDEDRLEKVAQA